MSCRALYKFLQREVCLQRTQLILGRSQRQSCLYSRLAYSLSSRSRYLDCATTSGCVLNLGQCIKNGQVNKSLYCTSTKTSNVVPVFQKIVDFWDKLAVVTQQGKYTYKDLLHYSTDLAAEIKTIAQHISPKTEPSNSDFLNGERVAFLCENDMSYVVTLLAVWMSGGVAVPLCKSHPASELEYFITDSGAKLIISSEAYSPMLSTIAKEYGLIHKELELDDYSGEYVENDKDSKDAVRQVDIDGGDSYKDKNAMMIYTSGTTGRPKGVVHTFGSLDAQIQGMIQAWGWSRDDVILHVLPLHHVHGVVNVLLTPLYCGATCIMMSKFDPMATWQALLNEKDSMDINVFMAVPTIYAKLMESFHIDKQSQNAILPSNMSEILVKKIRLMVSGSAALPQPVMERWKNLTGHTLLERYGMTEIGMALTNPLQGDRIPGAVGKPFPGVSVQIAEMHDNKKDYDVIATGDSRNTSVVPGKEGNSGELLVKGDNVFKEYWNKPEATQETFTEDGWFRTGDTAVCENGVFRIIGRTSVDIIKSGAYKISALDIEDHFLQYPDVKDVAILGLPDETWGQIIAAVLVAKEGHEIDIENMMGWARNRMPPYQVPKVYKVVEEMPRNAMGKVNKKDLAKVMFSCEL